MKCRGHDRSQPRLRNCTSLLYHIPCQQSHTAQIYRLVAVTVHLLSTVIVPGVRCVGVDPSMAYRGHLRDAVEAQLHARPWKLPDGATMTTQSLAYVYSKHGCSVADVFRTSYSTAIVSLLRGLGTAHAEIPAADSNISFAVTERDGVKPTSMLTTAMLTDNGVTPACRITGTKTFLAEDTRDIIAIAKLTPSSTQRTGHQAAGDAAGVHGAARRRAHGPCRRAAPLHAA
jgi:hypothetical protein